MTVIKYNNAVHSAEQIQVRRLIISAKISNFCRMGGGGGGGGGIDNI